MLSGNHRLRILHELGHESAPVVVVELDDAQARLLAQTLNRTRGKDDPRRYGELLERILADLDVEEVVAFLPDAPVAYLWHSALHGHEAFAGLLAAGFEPRQQIVWVKSVQVLGRAHYQWQHELCWYAVRKGASARWQGGRKQTTAWEAPSPIAAAGPGVGEDAATRHPTQKPLLLFERPILNHTRAGNVVYEPFGGSGSCLIAAEKTGRRRFALELDPRWCDVIRARYEAYRAKGGD